MKYQYFIRPIWWAAIVPVFRLVRTRRAVGLQWTAGVSSLPLAATLPTLPLKAAHIVCQGLTELARDSGRQPPPHPRHMLAQGLGQFVVQGEVDAPGEQQVIKGAHQPQAVVMAEIRRHQGEVDVGAGAMATLVPLASRSND